jgi:hypothetical protein
VEGVERLERELTQRLAARPRLGERSRVRSLSLAEGPSGGGQPRAECLVAQGLIEAIAGLV